MPQPPARQQQDPLEALAAKHGVGAQAQDPLEAVAQKHGIEPPPESEKADIAGMLERSREQWEGGPGQLRARLAGAARSIPFSDEIFGAAASLAGMPGVPISQRYRNAKDLANRTLDEATEGHEADAFVGEVAGSMLTPMGAAKTAKTLIGKLGRAALAGGTQGGLIAAGEAEGNAGERLKAGLEAAPWAAGASTIMAGALPIAVKGGRAAADMVPGLRPKAPPLTPGMELRYTAPASTGSVLRSDQERGADRLLEKIEADKLSLDDIAAERARRARNPKPETMNEFAGDNVGSLTEAVATVRPGLVEGPLTKRIGEPLTEGTKGTYARVRKDIERAFGLTGGSTLEAAEEIVARRAQAAKPLYDEAFKAGAVSDPELTNLLKRPSTKKAIGYAKELAEEAGENIRLPDEGAPIDTRTLHHIKLALDDAIAGSKLDTSTGPTKRARMIETRNQVREILHSNPAYKQAAEIWAGESALKDALEEGAEAMVSTKASAEDIRRAMSGMTDGEKAMYRQGAVNSLLGKTGDVGDGRNIVTRIAGAPNARERLRAMVDSDKSFEEFMDDLSREDAFYRTRNERLRGSQTARRLFGQDELTDVPASAPKIFSPSYWADVGINKARRQQMKGMSDALAPMLTAGTEGAAMTMDDLMKALGEAQARKALGGTRQARASAATGRIVGGQQDR